MYHENNAVTQGAVMKNCPELDKNFLHVLGHQLKSPITSIQSLLKTVTDGFTGELDPQARSLIEKAIRQAQEAQSLITDLLHYELADKTAKAARIELDIVALLETLAAKYFSVVSEKNIALRLVAPAHSSVLLLGQPQGLEIALRNLIENAVKYTPTQGRIQVKLALQTKTKRCLISVTDSGQGIPASEVGHIFDPFFRSSKHKASTSGTGLGLAITKGIITDHNGAITVSSRENHGTTFTVNLPYVKEKPRRDHRQLRKKVVIIGGVTAGPKAAARLRRLDENLDITIIEKSEFLSYAGCGLPSYISGKVFSPRALMSTADNTIRDVNFFESIKNIQAFNKTEALSIDRKKRLVRVRDVVTRELRAVPYDVLVLATGADSRLPAIPGIRQPGVYSLHRIEDAEAIKAEFTRQRACDVMIIGGGLIGIETAESLVESGARVTILEQKESILSTILDADLAVRIAHTLNRRGVKVVTQCAVRRVLRKNNRLVIRTSQGDFPADFIILSAGVKPNSALARQAGLALGVSGGIKVDHCLRTSDPRIYAIGDCAESVNYLTGRHAYWPLGSVSTKMGRIAADNIHGSCSSFQGFIGTAMFKVFDQNVARTGLTAAQALAHGHRTESMVVTGLDRAHYWKSAEQITLKVLADRKTGTVLGAAGYGRGDVVRQIGILACAISGRMTLDQVFKLDLGYAPAYNHPIELLQTAGLMLQAKIEKFVRTITPEEFAQRPIETRVIDVSPFAEHVQNAIPSSVSIPLENLRTEGLPFGPHVPYVLYSRTSSRAYEAYRYLVTKGYKNLAILEGGYLFWAQ
jgi:NADPH-dependent 2,4-dienoyl-CoA reductase/sulfur reductase-like enzyme/rhodanese-related sulfurtransferase